MIATQAPDKTRYGSTIESRTAPSFPPRKIEFVGGQPDRAAKLGLIQRRGDQKSDGTCPTVFVYNAAGQLSAESGSGPFGQVMRPDEKSQRLVR